jgi:hydroxyacylglutathione hydrolase
MEFCHKVDPENQHVQKKLHEMQELRKANKWSVPSTIEEERSYNVFMRAALADLKILELTATTDKVQAMKYLREWKNAGQKPNL